MSNTRGTLRERINTLSVRQRLLLATIIPLLIGFVVLLVVSYNQVRQAEKRLVVGGQTQLLDTTISQMEVFFQSLPETTIALSNSTALENLLSADTQLRDTRVELTEQQRSTVSQVRTAAYSDLMSEIFQIITHTPIYNKVRVINNEADEILRIEQSPVRSTPWVALTEELENLDEKDFYQVMADLNEPSQVHISGIVLNENLQPVLHLTTPIFYRGEKTGGVIVDILAESFLQFVDGPDIRAELTDKHLILLDSHGMYLADTRVARPEFGSDYTGYLLGFDPAGGVTLTDREPLLAITNNANLIGQEVGSDLVSSQTFNPFTSGVSGTPWQLVTLQDTTDALADLNRFSLILIATIMATMAVMILILWRIGRAVIQPLTDAAAIAVRVSAGDISARIPVQRDDEIGRLSQAINSMTEHLQDNITQLQEQFSERTRDLEVAGDIANIAVGISDVQALLKRTVSLIQERFSFYHVQVFLVNGQTNDAELIASTGDAGQKMLAEHWALGVGSDSVIGQVTANGTTVIALDTADAVVVHRPNPHLPETRSEMALPMRYSGEIIGALDIQSTYPNAFSPEDVRIFEVLANQLAIAVNNAHQLEETRRQVDRVQELNRRLTREAWDEFIEVQQDDLSDYLTSTVTLAEDPLAVTEGAIAAPIEVRGEIIGILTTAPAAGGAFDPDEIALISAVAERISLAVENARLVTETQVSLTETERLYLSAQIINSGESEVNILKGIYEQFALPNRIMMFVIYNLEQTAASQPRQIRQLTVDPNLPGRLQDIIIPYSPENPGMFRAEKYHHILRSPQDIQEAYSAPLAKRVIDDGAVTIAYFPFLVDDELLGHMIVGHRHTPYTFTDREVEIFEALTGQLATVLRSRQLFETVETERQRLQSVLETMPTAVMVLDATTGQPILSNELANNLLGEGADLRQLAAENRLYRADSDETYPLTEIPAMQALEQGIMAFSEDLAIRQIDGSSMDVMNNAAPILDAEGNMTAVVTVFQDITELRDLQSALQDTLRETTTMYESSQAIFSESEQEAIVQQTLDYLLANTEPDQVHLLMAAQSEQSFALTVNPIAVMPDHLPMQNPYPLGLLDESQTIIIPDTAAANWLDEETLTALTTQNMQALVTVPLQAAGDTIGWLALGFHHPQNLSADQIRFLEALTDQAAVSLQNTRLREQTESALNETLLLYDASRDINRAGSMQQILEIFVSFALGPEATAAAVLLLEGPHDNRVLAPTATWSADQHTPADHWSQLARQLLLVLPDWVIEEDQPYLIENYPAEIAAIPDLSTLEDEDLILPATVIVLPMIAAERVVGLVQINYAAPYVHTERRLRMYRSLVDQVASAVENRRLLEQARTSLSETERLYHASQIIRDADSVEEVISVLQSLSMTYAPSRLDIYILNEGMMHHIHHWDIKRGVTPGQRAFPPNAIDQTGYNIITRPALFGENPEQVSDDPTILNWLQSTGSQAIVSLPLNLRNQPMGRLIMGFSEERTFPKTERDYLVAVCDQSAIVIDNWTLLQRTQDSLDETQMLYETSSAIADVNEGAGILAALVEHAVSGDITAAQLVLLHGGDWHAPGARMEITATWSRDGSLPDLTGMVFSAEHYPGWEVMATPELLTIDDVETTDRFTEEIKVSYQMLDINSLVIIPLTSAGRAIGALFFGAAKPRHHTDRERRVYQSLAELATISLENINLLQQTQTRARQLQTSAEVSRTVTSLLDVSELLPRMVNLIQESFLYDHVQVFLLDETRDNALLQASTGETGQTMLDMHWSLEVGSASVIGQVIEQAEPVIALDTTEAAVAHRPNPFLPDTRSEMAIPLISRGEVVGALDVQSNQAGAFTPDDVAVLSSLADQIAVALDNARLFEESQGYTAALASQVQSLESLLDASQSFTTTLDAQEILDKATQYMVQLLEVDHCGIVIKDADSDHMGTVRAEYPAGNAIGIPIDLATSWWREEFDVTGMPVVVPDIATSTKIDDITRELLLQQGINQIVLIPLIASGGAITGSIGLDVYEGRHNFTDEELTLLQLFATQIATTYQNAQLFEGQQIAAQALELQVSRMETLYATSLALSESLDELAILETALSGIVDTLQVDAGMVFMKEGSDTTIAKIVVRAGDLAMEPTYIPFSANPYYAIWQDSPQPLLIEEIASTETIIPQIREVFVKTGRQSAIMAPLLVGGELLGGFGLLMNTPRIFEPAEITLLQTLATQVGLALQNANLFGQAQEQAENMSFLFNVTTAAAASTEMRDSMETVVHQISQNIDGDVYAVYLANTERNALEQVAMLSHNTGHNLSKRMPLSGMLAEQALTKRQPFIIGDVQHDGDMHGTITPDLHSLLAAPLFAADKITGLLLIFKEETNFYSAGNLQLLQALSGSLSAVVQNIQLLDDIRDANDRLRELDKIKSQFLANMSHELRTPLNSIIGFSRVILKGIDGPLTEMQEQDLETIHSSGQHLLNLINDILDSSKIEAEKLTLAQDWFVMDTVVDVARSMSVGLLKDKTVRLNVEAENNLPQVWGDEIRTRQVLLNLLSNAAKFTNEGSITISAFTIHLDDGPYIQISVSDTGIGIPEDKLDTVFAAFEQVDGSLTRASGGTGLGLPISKSLIELMGGSLWVESTINVGSIFSFTVPTFVKETADSNTSEVSGLESEEQLPYEEQEAVERKTIMVIDDEVGMHQMYRRYLNKAGYVVEATANPIQAEDLVRAVHPDIILLDVRMPQRDGWEVLGKFKNDEETAHIPIIICSIDPNEARGMAMGAVKYLTKPFLEDDLLHAVQEAEAHHIKERVLIVDDKPETVRLLVELLKEQDCFYVQTATSAQKALDLIQQKQPDLIMLDLNMPDVSGLELLEQLRTNPRTHNLPVLIITAEDTLADHEQQQLRDVDIYSKNALDETKFLTGVQAILGHNHSHN